MLTRATTQIEQGIWDGLHTGAQLYVSIAGQPVVDVGIGEARPGVAMTADSLTLWLSSCKPITAMALAQLVERGRLTLNDPIAQHVPEFGAHGKEAITIRHALTHSGGFRTGDVGLDVRDWDQAITHICACRPESGRKAGQRVGYHRFCSWFMLGEVVRRVDGRKIDAYLREEILAPLNMTDTWLGLTPDLQSRYGERVAMMYDTSGCGASPEPMYSSPRSMAALNPASNIRGPARELGRFYEVLLRGGVSADRHMVKPKTVSDFTSRQLEGVYDASLRQKVDWGLGVLPNNKRHAGEHMIYGYGRYASEAAYGHSGRQSSVGFADPRHKLVIVVIFNGMPGESPHQQRMTAALNTIYEELGIV